MDHLSTKMQHSLPEGGEKTLITLKPTDKYPFLPIPARTNDTVGHNLKTFCKGEGNIEGIFFILSS